MRKALTDKALEALKPQTKRYEVHDLYCPGLSVRVSPEGRKSFTVKYRYGIKQKRLTIGIYPRMSLAKARERAMDYLRQVDEGRARNWRSKSGGYSQSTFGDGIKPCRGWPMENGRSPYLGPSMPERPAAPCQVPVAIGRGKSAPRRSGASFLEGRLGRPHWHHPGDPFPCHSIDCDNRTATSGTKDHPAGEIAGNMVLRAEPLSGRG